MTEKDCMNAVNKLREDMNKALELLETKYSERIRMLEEYNAHLEKTVSYLETEISDMKNGKEFA